MMLKTSEFDYFLPPGRIAQKSVHPKDRSRLLVLDRKSGTMKHRRFFEIGEFLRRGDVLIFNDTKVFKARLLGEIETSTGYKKAEVFLLRCVWKTGRSSRWEALAHPGKKMKIDTRVKFTKKVSATVVGREDGRGTLLFEFSLSEEGVFDFLEKHGSIPTPPYAKEAAEKLSDYQTVYAKHAGSVAAPTAGFHFTGRLLAQLKKQRVEMAYLTLHVGLGTFRPIQTKTLEEHKMHEEVIEIPAATARMIARAKKEGRRVIAVGTTTVRALEAVAQVSKGVVRAYHGPVNIFIKPGFRFRVIDGLITNFHLPKSTLLVLVSSFAGRDMIMKAYQEAIKKKYRFYSFGDAMLIALNYETPRIVIPVKTGIHPSLREGRDPDPH